MLHLTIRDGADILLNQDNKRLNVMELITKKIKDGLCIVGFKLKKGESGVRLDIPGMINNRPVIRIGHFAFQNCKELRSVRMPNTINEIGAFAFEGCTNLTAVRLPPYLREIAFATFYRCRKLQQVEIPTFCKVIRGAAFEKCDMLRKVIIPERTNLIESYAFGEDYMLKADIRNPNITLEFNAFLR